MSCVWKFYISKTSVRVFSRLLPCQISLIRYTKNQEESFSVSTTDAVSVQNTTTNDLITVDRHFNFNRNSSIRQSTREQNINYIIFLYTIFLLLQRSQELIYKLLVCARGHSSNVSYAVEQRFLKLKRASVLEFIFPPIRALIIRVDFSINGRTYGFVSDF